MLFYKYGMFEQNLILEDFQKDNYLNYRWVEY